MSRPVYIKAPFSDERFPAPHSVVGIYGVISTYQDSYCIETAAEDLHLIAGIRVTLPEEEDWDGVGSAYIVSAVESPVDLHIYDSLGNHTGAVYDQQDGVTRIEFGIPNSLYLGPDFHPELIVITDPTTGPYRQELKGIEDGSYTLTTIAVDQNGQEVYQSQRIDEPIAEGETDVISIPVTQNESAELIVGSSMAVDPGIDDLETESGRIIRQYRPEHTLLLQSFPNPSNPETWIPYQLAKGANVTIQIYAIDGRLVKALDLGYKQSGYYTKKQNAAHWDGRNEHGEKVASSVYYYSIQAGDFSAVRKLILAE